MYKRKVERQNNDIISYHNQMLFSPGNTDLMRYTEFVVL